MDGGEPPQHDWNLRMTLMMFDHKKDDVVIITDTLVSTPEHAPAAYTTKFWSFPHLNMVMTVTGTAELGEIWCSEIRRLEHINDVDDLDKVTPVALQQIHSSLLQLHERDIGTSTVYTFGFPVGSESPVRYVYRSPDGYVSERSEDETFGIKPRVQSFKPDRPETKEQYIELAHRVREEYGEGSPDPVLIGGELYATRLTKDEITTQRFYRFPDYDQTTARMRLTSQQHVAYATESSRL